MECHGHSHHPRKERDSFIESLRQAGLRVTTQRKKLAEAIIKFSGPFSAEDLHLKVKSSGVDLVTVYRCLTTFTELDLVNTVDFQDGTLRYEYRCSGDEHHHHIVCKSCKKVEPVSFCAVEAQEQIIKNMGYSKVSHKLEFFGLCDSCGVS